MKQRILLVDDEAPLTRMMRRNIEATGRFEVLDVNDSTIALATAREFQPDLVFLDVMMPEVDGAGVAAAFANDEQLSKVPVVFLTAIVSNKDIAPSGSRVGDYLFLAKPIKFDDLMVCIDQHLGTVGIVDEFV